MSAVLKTLKQIPVTPVSIEVIDPPTAKRYLAAMVQNRSQVDAKIIEYAVAMDQGRWSLNGETIKFNAAGQLIDGQNRLQACLLADKSFETYVIRGLEDPRAFATIDVGKNRTHTDVLTIAGIPNQHNVVSAANLLILYDRKNIGWTGPLQTRYDRSKLGNVGARLKSIPNKTTIIQKDELLEWVAKNHEEIQEAVRKAHTSPAKRLVPVGTLAAVYFIGKRSGKIDQNQFVDDLAEGIGLGPRDPVRALREKLLTAATSKTTKLNRFTVFGMSLKAMVKRIKKESIAHLRVVEGEDFPRV